MARIKINPPEKYVFELEVPIRITDLNYGSHVGNERFLALVQEARYRYFQSLGHTETNFGDNIGIIMADGAVVYKQEVFAEDVLLIQMGAADFNKYGFDFIYRLTRKSDGQEVAMAKTGVVCFDYINRKMVLLPDWLREALINGA